MTTALYAPDGFFTRAHPTGPAGHFRTSAHVSPLFGQAVAKILHQIDQSLGCPDPLDIVDIGAGRGELLKVIVSSVPESLAARLRATAVELAPRPVDLPDGIGWQADLPASVTGLLIATEWLDNVPFDLAVASAVDAAAPPPDGSPAPARYVLVDRSGTRRLGPPVEPADAAWLARWWPSAVQAEIGIARDEAWADAVFRVRRGLALAIDYGHLLPDRPPLGTLTGYRRGRVVPAVPDGSCDLTAHVAFDSVARAGETVAGSPSHVLTQRRALHRLGVTGARPELALAATDPMEYLRRLTRCGEAAELTDSAGLGGHLWLLQPVGIDLCLSALLHGAPDEPSQAGDTVHSGEHDAPYSSGDPDGT